MEPALLLASDVTTFEVWNSGDAYVCGGRSDDEIWDYCLQRGKRLLAVAADDAHAYGTDFASGFTMVIAAELSKHLLCAAFRRGDFYASCGPIIYDMRIVEGRLKMHFSPVRRAVVRGYPADGTTIYPDKNGLIETLDWRIPNNLKYIRPMLVDAAGNTAWAQPIFISDLLAIE